MIVFLKKKSIISFAVLLCFLFGAVSYVKAQTDTPIQLPILMYHNISQKPSMLGKYTVLDKQFENDLIYIKKNGFQTITMTQLINYVKYGTPLPEKPIMITFDDGYESFYAYAYPLLQKYNMTAVMAIIGCYTDEYTQTEDHHLDYSHLNWAQVKELNESEFVEIQNHTYNMHQTKGNRKGCAIGNKESVEQYEAALKEDVGKLQNEMFMNTGTLANTFVYPFGCLCEESYQILKKMGFEATLSCTEKVNKITRNEDSLNCLGRFNRAHRESSQQFFERMLK